MDLLGRSESTASAETWYENYVEEAKRAVSLQAELDSIKQMTLIELVDYLKKN